MIWWVNILLVSIIFLLQHGLASSQFDLTFNLQPHKSKVFQYGFSNINLFKKNDQSLRNLSTELSIELPVDHFNASDHRKFKMRYFECLEFFKKNGPIVLQMGVLPDNGRYLHFAVDLAKELGGALYLNEHRYDGNSFPLHVRNYKDFGNYTYLSARQALADVASLLEMLKEKPEYKDSKVVAVGGAYGGQLAAWLRLQYPHLVDAAHASSAPVLAKVEYSEYMEKVNKDFESYCKPEDFERFKNLFKTYDDMLKTEEGTENLKKRLDICEDVDLHVPHNLHTLFYGLVLLYTELAEHGLPTDYSYWCPILGPTLNSTECQDTSMATLIKVMRNGVFPWWYQSCNEFGTFTTLSSKNQIFTQNLPIEYFHALCKGVFGPEFGEERVTRSVEEVNKLYGGKTPNVTRVVFTNGDMDPWSMLGITQDLSPEAPARLVHGATMGSDVLFGEHTPELEEVRKFSKKMIKKWLGL